MPKDGPSAPKGLMTLAHHSTTISYLILMAGVGTAVLPWKAESDEMWLRSLARASNGLAPRGLSALVDA